MAKSDRQRHRKRRSRKTVDVPVHGQTADVPVSEQEQALQSSAPARMLETATLLYLALPVLVFLGGFFRIELGVAACLCLVFAIYRYLKDDTPAPALSSFSLPAGPPSGEHGITRWKAAACLLAASFVVLLYFEGIGPFGTWSWDARKHLMILGHLSEDTWPPLFAGTAERFHLVYYIGYYLPAALVGKSFGWDFAYPAIVVWTLFGVFLALLWCFALSRKAAVWIIAVFFLFSGMDIPRVAIFGGGTWEQGADAICPSLFSAIIFDAEYYAKGCFPFHFIFEDKQGIQMLANLVQLVFTPQHALGVWLCGSLLMHSVVKGALLQRGGLIVVLALLWSTFTAVGVALLVVFCTVHSSIAQPGIRPGERMRTLMPAFSGINLAAAFPLFLACMYLLSKRTDMPGFLLPSWDNVVVVLLFEFFILWSVLYAFHRYAYSKERASWLTEDLRPLFLYALFAVFIFLPMPLDFQKNTSHLALFILMITLIRALEHSSTTRIGKAFQHAAIAIFAIGSITALSWLTSAVYYVYNERFAEAPRYTVHHDNTHSGRLPDNIGFNSQAYQFKPADNTPPHMAQIPQHDRYLGSPDSWYYRYLARKREK